MAPELRRDFGSDFDYDDPEFNERFDDVLTELVERCPVAHSDVGAGYWIVSRYEDAWETLRDWQTFTTAYGMMINRPPGVPYMFPMEVDPPRHRVWRAALNPYFSPEAVNAHQADVRTVVNELIDDFVDAGEADLLARVGRPLPQIIVSRYFLHFPESDMAKLRDLSHRTVYDVDPVRRAEAFIATNEYCAWFLEQRRTSPPRGDVIDALLALEEDGVPVPFEEQVSTLSLLLFGGLNTTAATFGHAVHYLATNLEVRDRLANDPSLVRGALEEFLRYFTPVLGDGRVATEDAVVAGTEIREGDQVLVLFAAANRDPREIGDTAVDIDRGKNPHIAFGVGPHRCIGSHLARMQLRVALEELLRRLPGLRLDENAEVAYETSFRRTVLALPLRWDTAG